MKKSLPKNLDREDKGPKTDFDQKFLDAIQRAKSISGIKSDRAMSIELGRHTDFINRVRNGFQSAPADAWDTLIAKFPEVRVVPITLTVTQAGGQAVGINHGTATQNNYSSDQEKPSSKQPDYILTTDTHLLIIELKNSNEQLKSQLADKERIIKLLEQSLNKGS